MVPRITNIIASGNKADKNRLLLVSMKYAMLLAYAVAFGLAAIAQDFAPLFFGSDFEGIGSLIMGLCIIFPFSVFGSTIIAQYIVPHYKEKYYSIIAIIAAAISVVANFALIPQHGAMGAVIGFILAEISRCIMLAFASRNALPIWVYIKNSLFFLMSGAMMFFLVRLVGGYLGETVLSVITQVIIGAVFYLGVNAIYLYKSKDDVFCNLLRRLCKS